MDRSLKRLVVAVAVFLAAMASSAAVEARNPNQVPGEKLDSGLGELPHYRDWGRYAGTSNLVAHVNHVPGEKLDSGLGELKHYRYWIDDTGRTLPAVASRR